MRSFIPSLGLFLSSIFFDAHATTEEKQALTQAVSLYHQAQYDSALTHLQSLKTHAPWKKRDSLSLFQYLGMTSTKLGQEPIAVDYFSNLLDLDSLFQFPTNEDPLILKTFQQAQELRLMRNDAPPPDTQEVSQALESSTLPLARPFPTTESPPELPRMGLAYGAIPLGAGWMARNRIKSGLAIGFIQASSILLSLYASERQNKNQGDLATLKNWQWTQRITLSSALGAYIFSLFAAAGD